MAVNPDIAETLREINDRIGDDFESSVASFQYTPTAPAQPQEAPKPRGSLAGNVTAAVRRFMVVALFVVPAAIGAAVFGPTIATWFEGAEPPTALALTQTEGEPTQRITVEGDTMYLEGFVPSQDVSDILESAAVSAVGRDRVINNFEISDEAVFNPNEPIQLSVAEPVLFSTGVAKLDEQYRPLIDLAVDLMKAEPTSTLSIIGHTDDVGEEEFNLALSMSRAEAVASLVIEHGVDPSRLTVEGRGESAPLESNETPEGRAVNRRVEFSILGAFGN